MAKTVSRVVTAGSMALVNRSGNITHLFHFRTKPLSVAGVRTESRFGDQGVDAGHQLEGSELRTWCTVPYCTRVH